MLQSMVAITIAEIMKIPPISGVLGFSGWSSMRGDICTQCNPDLLWSHRATNGQRGLQAGFIVLA